MDQLVMFPELGIKPDLGSIKFSSDTNEWYTPQGVAMAASLVMDGIELDPASSEKANESIKAERFYTRADDGLKKSWKARSVWLNPPYGKYRGESNQGRWSHRLVYEYQQGSFQYATLLVGAYWGYVWFTQLIKLSSIAYGRCGEEILSPDWAEPFPMPPMCLTFDLLRFKQSGNSETGKAKTGSAIFFYGQNLTGFRREFSRFGFVIGCD